MITKKKDFKKSRKPKKVIKPFILSPERLSRLLDEAKHHIYANATRYTWQLDDRYKYDVQIDWPSWRIKPTSEKGMYEFEVPFRILLKGETVDKKTMTAEFSCAFE